MKRKEAIVFTALLLFSILPNLLIVCMAEDWTTALVYCYNFSLVRLWIGALSPPRVSVYYFSWIFFFCL